ncbi:uncharacterized protein ACBR49_019272 [Aulostomus maculatus]
MSRRRSNSGQDEVEREGCSSKTRNSLTVQPPGVQEDTGSLGMWYDEEEEDDEEERLMAPAATSSRQRREDLKDPDYQMPSRVSSDRKKPGRPRISDTQNHLDLKIRILEDCHTDVLSKSVFQKCPVQELQCPRGLQEDDFLRLLRSTFPQLAGDDKPFDVFTCDRNKRLNPLRVKALTPEEIYSSTKSAGFSALYIRLKSGQELPPPPEDEGSPSSSAARTADQPRVSPWLPCTRGSSEKRRRGRPRLGEEPTHHFLRVCMLGDFQGDVVSKEVFQKCPVQELSCPRDLEEADFLDLLKSVFPQLDHQHKPFNVYKSDRSRRLQRLNVKTLRPEEIYRAMRSTGAEKAIMYIRLKTEEEEEEEEEEEVHLGDIKPSEGDNVTLQASRSAHQVDEADGEAVGGEAAEGDDNWTPSAPRKRLAKSLGVEVKLPEQSKTPCKVCGVWYRLLGSLIKHAWKHTDEQLSSCGVCGETFPTVDELKCHLRTYQQTHICSYCGKSFLTLNGLKSHTTLHTGNRPYKCDVCHKGFVHMSSLSVHRWVHVVEKPHKCDICQKAFGLKAQLRAHAKAHTGQDKYHCNICGKAFYDMRSLTRHKVTHSGERRYGCEVCGKRFKLPDTLKSHEKIHTSRDRPYLCHICCKTFLSNCGLTAHMKTHSNERPFICVTCSKGFISNGELKAHMRVHTGEAPYGCSECGRYFKRKTHLTNHIRTHLGIKLFVCSVCGKACSRQEHLTVHMRTHNGERPYQCSLCDKAFTQAHCLKTHMKSHRHQREAFTNVSPS